MSQPHLPGQGTVPPGGHCQPLGPSCLPSHRPTAQDVPAGCALPRAGLGEASLPTVRRSPRVRARSCLFPAASSHLSVLAAAVARILAHEAGVTDMVVLQVTPALPCPTLSCPPCPARSPPLGPSPAVPSSPARRRPPCCTTQWRTRTPRSRRSRSGSVRRCGAWWRR